MNSPIYSENFSDSVIATIKRVTISRRYKFSLKTAKK